MALQQVFDTGHYESLAWPYDRIRGELDPSPRIVAGLNTFVTAGDKLGRRPATKTLDSVTQITKRPARVTVVETLESPSKIYIVGSFYNSTTARYEIWWLRLDAGSPAWTKLTDLRSVNLSYYPHEMESARGLLYIKAFPLSATGEKLGSVILDGTGGTVTVRYWGLLGPTEPAHVVDPGTWSAQVNAHAYQVLYGWQYVYAYVTDTGQVSNRSDLETNLDKLPSDTGNVGIVAASGGFCPEIQVQGIADTTRVPYINIYRTTDGGGTFYFIKQIANTGAGTITFIDKYFESGVSGGTFEDPMSDSFIDTTQVAPSLTSNSPPPACRAPKVTGVDAIERSTPIVSYANRLWYAIGHYVFNSAQEEISAGVPEECFPSGLNGNFFKTASPVTNVVAAADGVYVLTVKKVYRITGTNKQTFEINPWLHDIGHPWGHPRGAASIGDGLAWLGHDFRVMYARQGRAIAVTDPLWTDIRDAVNGNGEIDITRWTDLEKDYLIVASHRTDTDNSRQWIMDMKRFEATGKPFWFAPWDIPAVAMFSARTHESLFMQRMVFVVWDGTTAELVYLDPTNRTNQDRIPTGDRPITWYFNTHLEGLPAGNHVNAVNAPARTPSFEGFRYERSMWAGDQDPRIYFFLDDFWTDPKDAKPSYDPSRRGKSKSYNTTEHPERTVAQRVGVKVQIVNSTTPAEFHSLTWIFAPGSGV